MVKSYSISIVAAAVCLCAPSEVVSAPPAPIPQSAPVPANALRLSNLINPTDKMLELGMKAFQAGIDGQLKRDPDAAAVYARNPGLLDAIAEAGRPIVQKHFAAVVPTQQRKYAEFYAARFSAEEIDQLISFYSSPTGTKVIAAMYAGANLDQLFEKAVARKDTNLTAKDVSELNGSATAQLPDKFDAEDWKAMFVFTATPAYAKLLKAAPEFNQLVADVQNEPDPAMDAELDKAVEAAVEGYMAKRKSKPAS